MRRFVFFFIVILLVSGAFWLLRSEKPIAGNSPPSALAGRDSATIVADVVALDSLLVYNRFGSFNPFGMIFALREDVVPAATPVRFVDAADCEKPVAEQDSRAAPGAALSPGAVRLRDCKRARPLTLRANVGDTLEIHFQNLLADDQPDVSKSFCPVTFREPPAGADNLNDTIWKDEFPGGASAGRQHCRAQKPSADGAAKEARPTDWPRTRRANFAIAGLKLAAEQSPKRQPGDRADEDKFDSDVCLGVSSLPPGGRVVCRYEISHEGPFFASSSAAPSGGEGDGGSITHGLFAAVVAEPRGSAWYRSQVTRGVFDAVWPNANAAVPHARAGALDYELADQKTGVPHLNMLKAETSDAREKRLRLVHSDLNAIIREPTKDGGGADRYAAFREFTVMLHDELKTFYPNAYRLLGGADGQFSQLAGVRDGFGINYGAGGMGPMLIANRKGIGPAADCVECLYEEFFLQSWANGDPALLEHFPDDPSNVHHSYLNDRVVFRNFHAGPKETHVFHLHAHQWFAGNDPGRGSYLDSQTIGPQQGFTYRIYHGGLRNGAEAPQGWWETNGAGNRNRSPGDSIFHCHLYPHFAQGMWELWRTHDVLEDGSRKLPDGQTSARLSMQNEEDHSGRAGTAPGGVYHKDARGTPIPAIVPLPDEPAPLLPTYGEKGMPGYPFYIAGKAGRRAPQPPLDMALDANGKPMDAGLPRHVVESGERKFAAEEGVSPKLGADGAPDINALLARSLAIGDFTAHFESLRLKVLPNGGDRMERNGMAFHHDGAVRDDAGAKQHDLELLQANGAPSAFDATKGGYATFALSAPTAPGAAPSSTATGFFYVNGAPPRPGAPFADPCGAADGFASGAVADPFTGSSFSPDPDVRGFRRYEVSAVQLKQMVVNKAGWHDPQARIDVLSSEADQYKDKARADAAPFFFRARSKDCIEFRHTNELPHKLARDDFQVATPTDTIGQHIHLVKFDVTASDGSGNGWNYEDGTFAPDEIAERICKSQGAVTGGATELRNRNCGREDHWKAPRLGADSHPEWFQTTVQRWFADPILSQPSLAANDRVDRTMRTVFSHDHFGPSSIQQHGFYTALVIEPRESIICPEHVTGSSDCDPPPAAGVDLDLKNGDQHMVGPRKLVLNRQGHSEPDAREYALAVADFALLYDPKSPKGADQYKNERPAKGLVCLAREAEALAAGKNELSSICSGRGEEDVASPILFAGYTPAELKEVAHELAADARDLRNRNGRPIAAPARPEGISVDHHDPYLVNYRNEPPLLRIGATKPGTIGGLPLGECGAVGAASRDRDLERSIAFQRQGDAGDLGESYRSLLTTGDDAGVAHGDPCTPILDVYDNERIQIRLIQGAQEVQHVFTVEGVTFPRNYDQRFPAQRDFTSESDDARAHPTWWRKCHQSKGAMQGVLDIANLGAHETAMAVCDNIDGRETGQEIGISEHFEFNAPFRREGVVQAALAPPATFTPESAQPRLRRAARELKKDLFADPIFANRVTASDYIYHFGTLDAQWNGAWGLLRVHEAPAEQRFAYDIGLCLKAASDQAAATPKCIKEDLHQATQERLTPLAQASLIAQGGSAAQFDAALAQAKKSISDKEAALRKALSSDGAEIQRARPKPKFAVACPPGAPHVRATAVAAEADDLNKKGIVYHPQQPELRDPDGRLLALIPSKIVDQQSPAIDPITAATSRQAALDSVKATLAGGTPPTQGELPSQFIRPFVLRINAGDCLDLTLVNALAPDPADHEGDALMPKIAPLNVDVHNGWDIKTGALIKDAKAKAASNVKPSSKLALSIPLTATSNQSGAPTPVGVSPGEALAPGSAARMFYYAGVLRENFFDIVERALAKEPVCADVGIDAARFKRYDPADIERDSFIIDVLGRWYVLEGVESGLEKRGALAKCIGDAIAADREGAQAFMPYAFGALPVKPLGDVFNQIPHGLFGAIVVEPKGACYEGRNDPTVCLNADASVAEVTLEPSKMRESAQIRLTVGLSDVPAPERPLSEHVLFWQDGLNLWAHNPDAPVADCHVCDDSYDFGKKGVSYRSTPFYARRNLRGENPYDHAQALLNGAADVNAVELGPEILHVWEREAIRTPTLLSAAAGDEEMLRIVHPGGRARQRAFILTGNGFDDLFPGFGFPNAALLAPGKAITAASRRPLAAGCHLWRDGPSAMVGHGAWGLLEVKDKNGNGACPVSQQPYASQ